MPPLLIAVISLALVFGLINGMLDSGNILATLMSSRALRPRVALLMTIAAEFAGPFVFGVAVARSIGRDFFSPAAISLPMLVAALVIANGWNLFAWWLGIPSSSSHALVGALLGAVVVGAGPQSVRLPGLLKVLLALFLSPAAGFGLGFVVTRLVFYLARGATPRVNDLFKNTQILTGLALALSHGANDAPKTMGLITLGLLTAGRLNEFAVPLWVMAASAGALALGTSLGGYQLIRTLGARFYRIRPVHGFSSQLTAAAIVLTASLVGGPVSTTQVVSSAILGVGAAERLSKVRWRVAANLATAWLLTIPVTGLLAAGLWWLLARI